MSPVSRVLSRLGFGTGALATTAIIFGGFAAVTGDVKFTTLRDGLGSNQPGPPADRPQLAADPTTPERTTGSSTPVLPGASTTPPTTASTMAAATTVPPPRRSTSTSRSVESRTVAPPTPTPSASGTPMNSQELAQQVLVQINDARATIGLPALTMSAGLVRSAASHNKTMSNGCGLAHQCPGESDLGQRINAQGVTWTAAGENIGQGGPEPNTGAAIVSMAQQLTADMLAEKPPHDGHRKNILSKSFTHIGIALYRDSKGTVWMTQDFSS